MKGIYEKVDVIHFAMCAFAILAEQEPFAALAKQASFEMGVMIANEFGKYSDRLFHRFSTQSCGTSFMTVGHPSFRSDPHS